ncbi:hypothetical protein DET50_103117 [Marinobacter pelagius]|uniref:Lipoprotein n=1 Tax=Marinobacter pelagius TaxID=379482 RepID=A0A366GWJ9_9GAMM|nr:hypothetical protein [Marinobacter pelagius]RBP32557.1 hypothetical protein DET50_103117 [Marinobacter pelagius]
MGMMIRVILIAAAGLLAGCVMAPVHYYEPVAPGYKTKGGPCSAGPEDRVLLEYGDITLQVSIERETDRPALLIGIDIPDGHVVTLLTDQLSINGEFRDLGPARTWSPAQAAMVTVGPELVGSGTKKFRWIVSDTSVLPRHFTIETPLPPGFDVYRIQLPAVLLDGEPTGLPELIFRKASGVFSTPINC